MSEVYGLTWDCVDFEKKTLTINKNIIKKNQYGLPKRKNITKGHSVGVWYYGDCKNPQSRRTISIGDTLVNALKDYRKEQEENRKFYGDSYLCYYEKKVINEITKREQTEDEKTKDTEEKEDIKQETKEENKQETEDKKIENTNEKTTSKVTKKTSGTVVKNVEPTPTVPTQNGNVLETIKTNKNGGATTKRLPIDQKYTIQEAKTLQNYVLNDKKETVTLTQDQITDITFENEKIKGKIEITKVSKDDNQLTKEVKGTKLENAVFEIYTEKDKLVDTITTAKDGKATSKLLEYGNYYVKEKNPGSDYYLLNT